LLRIAKIEKPILSFALKSYFLWPYRVIRAHPRLFRGVALGLIIGLTLPQDWRLGTRSLIAWDGGTWFYFFASALFIVKATPQSMRKNAKSTDEGKFTILILASLATLVAVIAIFAQLATVKDQPFTIKIAHVALAGVTILSAWFFIHLCFALHYAHEFYDELEAEAGKPRDVRGGLVFPGNDDPDYFDFLYFSYVIGVASQTADIGLSSRAMRRVALVHCILAFFFNSAVLALTINIAASLT
jgi:uncharacterized membrane protein